MTSNVTSDESTPPVSEPQATPTPTWRLPADIDREAGRGGWAPGAKLLAAIRDYQAARNPVARKVAVLRHRFWSAVTGCELPLNGRLGTGLRLPHPIGIVIHPEAVVGENCLIMHNVTLGTRGGVGGAGRGLPVLGRGVDVGPGAQILGGVTIGDGAQIGANAVVTSDVPARAVAVGIPARVVKTDAR